MRLEPNLPRLKEYRTALNNLRTTRGTGDPLPDLPWKLPRGYVRMIEAIAPQFIDEDYRIHDGAEMTTENLLVDLPSAQLGIRWMVFAITQVGDAWAIRLDGADYPETGFINHESDGDVRRLGISLKDWLRVAYFSRECAPFEAAITTPTQLRRAKRHVRTQLESISLGLTRRFPNTFF